MLKLIYEILVNPLGLPIEPIWEYLIIVVVGEIAHEIAYSFSPGGKLGSPKKSMYSLPLISVIIPVY